jgi:xanthine dehydrogenase molybdenum-binding subunit
MSDPIYKVIGTRPIRHDGVDKVTGRALYGADVQMAGLLHGRILRSPHAHARIRGIDASRALTLPGVEAVVTGADFPDPGTRIAELGEGAIVLRHLSSNCLARGKALYEGHAVAAVAAVSPHVAEEALKLIAVDYELLPPVLDVRDAMRDDAPLLHDDLTTESLGQPTGKHSNVAKHLRFRKGDVAAGFAAASVVLEREFHTATVHQGYIEPHNATALWNADGSLTIWCSTQGPSRCAPRFRNCSRFRWRRSRWCRWRSAAASAARSASIWSPWRRCCRARRAGR